MNAIHARKPLIVSLLILAALTVALSACFPFTRPQIESPVSTSAIHTAAAATIVAEATLSAGKTAVAQLTQMAQGGQPSATPLPPTATGHPTSTATQFVPTATYTFVPPTHTAVPPTSTPVYIPPAPATPVVPWYPPNPPQQVCDWVQFVTDVTTPDGSDFAPGQTFSKVWRLRNIGACTWTRRYALVFVNGDRMQAARVIPMHRNVPPGDTIDIGVDLIAPNQSGSYRGYWMLTNQYGQAFGIGQAANKAFWVDIDVRTGGSNPPPGNNTIDFIANMCNADWRSNSRHLPCPGNPNSENGSIVLLNTPDLETGKHENEPALWTRPEASRDGQIAGWYPAYRVRSGDHFLADIGCLEDSRSCDVTFFLDAEMPNGNVRHLGSWHEVYDGKLTRIDVNLSELDGQTVRLILRVQNNGRANSQANAFWLVPQIRRLGDGNVPVPPPAEPDVVSAARSALANALGIGPNQITVIATEPAYWPDACLGIPRSGEVCAQTEVYGYRMIMAAQNQMYEVRTNQNGSVIRWMAL